MKTSMNTFKKHTLAMLIAGLSLGAFAGQAFADTVTSKATESVIGHAPTLTAGSITYTTTNPNGALGVGDKVTIATEGTFADADGDSDAGNTYSWKVDGNEKGTDKDYTITSADMGGKLMLEVTPHTDPLITDPAVGAPVAYTNVDGGDSVIPIVPEGGLISVAIEGATGGTGAQPIVSETKLTAIPSCTDATGALTNTCDNVTYQWELETAIGSGAFDAISGATSDTYTPVTGDQKKRIQVTADGVLRK